MDSNFKLIAVFLQFLFSFFISVNGYGQELYLNEIMSVNSSTISDEDGDFEDWIEIFYNGDTPLNLRGFGLSDDYDQPFRWVFPDTTIQPGEFMIIWASSKNRSEPGDPLHTNYGIASNGEEIILTSPDSVRMDELAPIAIPPGTSIGRQPDGVGDWYFFMEPTPGGANISEGYQEQLESPDFSHEAGFYSESFELEISHPDPDVTIYYTLDGSEPDENSYVYSNSISIIDRSSDPNSISTIPTNFMTAGGGKWIEPSELIRKGNIIRAIAVKTGSIRSNQNRSFFVFEESVDTFSLGVVSLITDSLNLFSQESGIYVPGVHFQDGDHGTGNYFQRGIEWERPASLEFFETDGSLKLNQDIGIRIHGGWTRRMAKKSLRLYARSDYGENRFNYKMFLDIGDDNFNRFILRSSGNDSGQTLFMDAAAQSLIRHFNVDTQAYRPVIVFINGEFWGIHNVRERYDRRYLERVYSADPENIDLLSRRNDIVEGDSDKYNYMIEFIQLNDLSISENFTYVETLMDIDNFLDYYSAQIYFGNDDWPHNNIDFWRSRLDYHPEAPKGLDGRWRWLLYDVDRSLGFHTGPEFDIIEWLSRDHWSTLIYHNLLENYNFKKKFINRLTDHLNTAFYPAQVITVIDSLKSSIEPYIDEHITRWPNLESRNIWESRVQRMYEYAIQRPGYQRQHMMQHFDIGEEVELAIDVSSEDQGFIRVNSTDILASTPGVNNNPYPWSGIYFSEVPVTLTAESKDGYVFSHWSVEEDLPESINQAASQIEVNLSEASTFTAHFREAEFGDEQEVIHYWVFSVDLPNNTPIEVIEPVYSVVSGARLVYESAITPYPPDESVTDGILDRVNDPTELNFISSAYSNLSFEDSNMRGIRVRNPSLVQDMESALIFEVPTTGYEAPEFSFATVRTSNGQEKLIIDYSIDGENWTDEGVSKSSATLYEVYKPVSVSLGEISEAVNNPNLKLRIRFGGDEEIRSGVSGNVRFNNVLLTGTAGYIEDRALPTVISPHILSDGYYLFTEWDENEPDGSYPESLVFVYMNEGDPGLNATISGITNGRYDLDSRTRINGLGEDGFAFINTDNPDGNPGYPGRRLGGAVLVLDTQNEENIQVSWKGGTVLPNSRIYNIRLQYRIGNDGSFQDLLDSDGEPVEYIRSDEAGYSEFIGPVTLPEDAEDQPEVQLLWRYYHTGEQTDEASGQRTMLNISQIHVSNMPGDNFPEPHILSESPYKFDFWPADTTAGATPENITFVYMDEMDPTEWAGILGFTSGAFNHEARTRIIGLDENGFAFINTSNQQGNSGYPGTRLGGALLGLDTRDRAEIEVSFTGNTILPNSLIYHLRLQYRVGNEGKFHDVLDADGNSVEYAWNELAGHSKRIGPVILPEEAENQEYIQLLWRYYYTGERVDDESGQRSKLSISEIHVSANLDLTEKEDIIPSEFALYQNYPNPFNPGTIIEYDLPQQEHVRIEIFNSVGQRVSIIKDEVKPAGSHQVNFDASALASGVYLYRITAGSFAMVRSMTFIK